MRADAASVRQKRACSRLVLRIEQIFYSVNRMEAQKGRVTGLDGYRGV
jgi:hypothetical protein